MAWHPPPPGELRADLDLLIERNISSITRALRVRVDSPAFALCLFASDEPELYAAYLALGLEEDRAELTANSTPWDAAVEVWNGGNYTYDGLEVPDPRSETAFLEAEARLNRWLADAEVPEPSRWAMEEVAFRLTRRPPVSPVTDDFVAYAFEQGDDLTASLRWIVPPETQALLERKRLLVDDVDALPGAPDYG
jgi:hypothetical protein